MLLCLGWLWVLKKDIYFEMNFDKKNTNAEVLL